MVVKYSEHLSLKLGCVKRGGIVFSRLRSLPLGELSLPLLEEAHNNNIIMLSSHELRNVFIPILPLYPLPEDFNECLDLFLAAVNGHKLNFIFPVKLDVSVPRKCLKDFGKQ